MENEIWKPIKDYEGLYEISNLGRVRSLDREVVNSVGRKQYYKGKILKGGKLRGYLRVTLFDKNKKRKTFQVHVLVAHAFVDGWFEGAEIDHINTIRDDNRSENLKWVTHTENMNNPSTKKKLSECQIGEKNHRYGKELSEDHKRKLIEVNTGRYGKLHPNSKSVVQISLDYKVIKIWDAAREAEREVGYDHTGISACCKGKLKTYKGFKWMYYTDYIKLNKEVE